MAVGRQDGLVERPTVDVCSSGEHQLSYPARDLFLRVAESAKAPVLKC